MPGTPPTTPNVAIPRYSDGDTAAFSSQVNGISDRVDAKFGPRSASLPGSPSDGDECVLVADATNGVVWQFRYNAGSASSYKWEFIGGPPLYAEVQTSEGTTSTVYVDLTTVGPALTLPSVGGDFVITAGAMITSPSTLDGSMAYSGGGITASDADRATVQNFATGVNSPGISVSRPRRKTGLTSGATITAKYRGNSGGGSCTFANRFLQIVPVRVG